jgi:D-alanyl-D-alanine endopeptidase (penicillin-binding protein 7)
MKKHIILTIVTSLMFATSAAGHYSKNLKTLSPIYSTYVLNQTTNSPSYAYNSTKICSIASITKLMTAMIVLDTVQHNLQHKIQLKNFYLGRNEFTVAELLDLLLVRSDNHVAELLSKNLLNDRAEFIAAMNRKAKQIGMTRSTFVDPSGLDYRNQATAQDIATMVLVASEYPSIHKSSSKRNISVKVKTKKGVKLIKKPNTNYAILNEFNSIILSKTGTTDAAGKCVVLVLKHLNQTYAVVVLGKPNKAHRDREVRKILHSLQHNK